MAPCGCVKGGAVWVQVCCRLPSLCFAPSSTLIVEDAYVVPCRLESQSASESFVGNWVTFLSVWKAGVLPSTWHLHHLGTSQSSKVQIQVFDSAPFANIGGEW